MAILATIAKPEYDNIIKANPSGSAYAWSASTGVLDANFADTIGTEDSIQILTQGYQFAWKPDTVNVLDDAGNRTLLDNVNANATAQVWNNKITYVGTTAATSDEFVVEGNQLKHSVRMVAPPILPSGFTGTPQFLAIGGDIGTTAEDWAAIDLWADGTTHLTDFTTSDDLRFCLKSDGSEIYRIPKITLTDDAGNETNGQYKLVFSANNVVTLYMLCPWSWMQTAQYPIIIDPTVIVSSAYQTVARPVRLSNNWIVTVVWDTSTPQVRFYVSKDNGQTWSQLCYVNGEFSSLSLAIASSGTIVYGIWQFNSNSTANNWFAFDASTVTNTVQSLNGLDSNQTYFGSGCSLAFDGQGNLHAAWCSKNSTYPNSFNIRYSKGTVSGTTVTWASPTQITTDNNSSYNSTNPCVVVNSQNNPTVVWCFANGAGGFIYAKTWNGTSWGNTVSVYTANYTQSNPCAAIDSNGVIHVVWQGTVLITGGGTAWQVCYSKSTDGGNTWSAMKQLNYYTGQHYYTPTITADSNNNLYVFYAGLGKPAPPYQSILYVKYTASSGTWSTEVGFEINNTNGTSYSNPQSIWSGFDMNSTDAVRMMFQTGSSVEYDSIPLDSPPNAPILTPASNFDATTAETLYWQFSDPDPGDSPSAYELQIVDTSNSSTVLDTGKVASTTSSYTLAANTLTNGKTYQWRVQTWDSQGQQGVYSAYSTFSTASTPTVSITSPASSATVTTSSLTVQFSYSDPVSNAQQSYQIQLLQSDDATVIEDSGTLTSTNNQYTLQTVLANSTTYHIRARATNSKSVTSAWSDVSFSTAFTPPNQPTLTSTSDSANARITISIGNPAGGKTVASNSLYKRVSGTTNWTLVASNLSSDSAYVDYIVASGLAYDYKATAYGNDGTQIDSDILTTSVSFTGDWVYNPISGAQFQFLYNRKAYNLAISEERKEVQTFGTKPMVRRGPLNARTGTLDALLVKIGTGLTPIQQLQAFESDMAPHNPYYLKTAAGEVFKVDLYQATRSMPAENLNTQAIEVSVNWTEIA